jgi:hypothetical protein
MDWLAAVEMCFCFVFRQDYGMLGYTTTDGDQPVPHLVSALEGRVVKWVFVY